MSKNAKTVIVLMILAVLIAAVPLFVLRDAEFGGSDDAGSVMVEEIQGEYTPWATPVLENALGGELPGEVESLIFCVQTGIGVGIIAFFMGRFVERKKWMKAAGADSDAPGAAGHRLRQQAADGLVLVAADVQHRGGGAGRAVSRKRRPGLGQHGAADVGRLAAVQKDVAAAIQQNGLGAQLPEGKAGRPLKFFHSPCHLRYSFASTPKGSTSFAAM